MLQRIFDFSPILCCPCSVERAPVIRGMPMGRT